MTQVAVRTVGGVLRADYYPLNHYGAWYPGGSEMTFVLESDLGSPDANVLAMPNCPLTVLSQTPVNVTRQFFGTHVMSNHPPDDLVGYTATAIRSHDYRWSQWRMIETAKGVFDWAKADDWVNKYYSQGKLLVWTLFGTPTWASARPGESSAYGALGMAAEPANMQDWTDYCTAVATRYAGKITHFEVWNEPNASGFYSGTQAKLSEMVRRAAQAIKGVIPSAKILCPPVTSWSATAGQSAETYFTGMMAASDGASGTMRDWVDIVAVHLYIGGNAARSIPGMIDRVRAGMATAGVNSKPLWDTESAPISPDAASISTAEEIAWMKRAYVSMLLKGVERSFYYAYDHGTMGVKNNAEYIAAREAFIDDLCNKGIQSGCQLWDGRVAYMSGGQVCYA